MSEEKSVWTKEEIESLEGTQKSHYLNANAKRLNKSLGDLVGLKSMGFHLIEVPPGGESTEYHSHSHEDECTYVLSGSGLVRIGEQETPIGAGDFIGYPAGGQAHTMFNTGDEMLICIVVGTRAAYDVADYPNLGKQLYRIEGRSWELVDTKDISFPNAGKK